MPRGPRKKQPSLRNLELYHEIICLGRPQNQVAAEFHVSPPRAAAICQQVKDWVDALLPNDVLAHAVTTALSQHQTANTDSAECETIKKPRSNAESETIAAQLTGNPACRLHLALAIRRIQLRAAYGNYLDCFGGPSHVLQLAAVVALWKDGKLAKQLSDMLPSMHLVESAVQMAQELEGLANLALRGPFFDLPDRLSQRQRQTASPSPDAAAPQPDALAVALPLNNSPMPGAALSPNP
jgi:hypothetical protein